MDAKTIFTKTAKGVTQVNQKTQSLAKDLMKVLKTIDGKSTVAVLAEKVDLAIPALTKLLATLQKDAYVKVFEVKREEPLTDFGGNADDFDFTATKKVPFDPSATASFKPSQYRSTASDGQVERATAPAVAPRAPAPTAAQVATEVEIMAALAKSREKAQTEARARTEREAQLRARLDVEARARRDAEERALEEARRAQAAAETARVALDASIAEEKLQRDRAKEAHAAQTREQAEIAAQQQKALSAARAAAESEAHALAEARARAETEARALAEARVQAEAAAKRQQAEFEAAQRDLRHQLKEEIEAKVRAEMETLLKSDVEESARAEVEAAIMAEGREDARRMLEEQLQTERTTLARVEVEAKANAEVEAKKMLAEQEVRIRKEMEAQIARIREESARVEAESRKMAEAQAAASAKASAEFAVRLKAEEDARRKTQVQAEALAVENAKKSAEFAVRLKAEEDARRATEAEAEARKRVEAQNRERLEARVREEAADRVRVETEMKARLTAEKEAKVQAQARTLVEQELREKSDRESQAKLEQERRAREEAEQKVVAEKKGREAASREAAEQTAQRERIEQEAEARIAAEREGRERVEQDAEARIAVERQGREKAEEKARADEEAEQFQRDAQVARLKELTEQHEQTAREQAAAPKVKKRARKKNGSAWRWLVVGAIAFVAFCLLLVQVVPLGTVNTRLAKSLAEWLHDDVSSGSLRVALFPRPHVKIENLALGKAYDAKAASGRLYMDLATLFGDRFVIDTLELTEVNITADALPRALKWADAEGRGKGIEIGKIVLRSVKADVSGVALDLFDAELKLDKAGKIISASARAKDGKWNLDVSPNNKVAGDAVPGGAVNDPWVVEFSARGLNLPMGTPVPIGNLTAKGTMFDGGMAFPQLEAKLFEGTGTGNLGISWKEGLSFNAELGVEKIKVDQLAQVFTRDISLSGKLEGRFTASGAAPNVGTLLDKPVIQGNFEVRDGSIGNVDLVQVMRSPGSVGGQSKFSELTGQLRVSDGVVRYEKMKFTGGVLLANGNVNVVLATSVLTGGVTSEIRSSVVQDRASFSVGGKVSRPALRRGN